MNFTTSVLYSYASHHARQLACLITLCALATNHAVAVPLVLAPPATLSVFDTGGNLNASINGGFTLGGLEVDTIGSVFVVGADNPVGQTSTQLQLLQSSGLATATAVGAAEPIGLNTRGFDLTKHPTNGRLHVVGTMTTLAPVAGIYGLDPTGATSPSQFAATSGGWATSGLTFDAAGTTALVSTDGAGAPTPLGLHRVPAGGPATQIIAVGALPTGIPAGTDDHVITLDGRTIIVGDGSHDIWDVSGGAGSVSLLIDLDLATAGPGLGVGGNRAAVDPVSGDIFVAWGLSPGSGIVRVLADGSGASLFATGMPGERIRDLDFGPASDGSGGTNLYVAGAMINGDGSIYEITTVPEPTTVALAALSLGMLLVSRRWKAN